MPSPPGKVQERGLSHLRVTISDSFYLGPGRADLMELIAGTGSISEAAKRMGMSYKRAWSLVQTLNETFGSPLVEASRGGSAQGGAVLTAAGRDVVARYRAMQAATRQVIGEHVQALADLQSDLLSRK